MGYLRNLLLGVIGALVVLFVWIGYMKYQNQKNFPSQTSQPITQSESDDFSQVKGFLPENFPFPADVSSVSSVKFSTDSHPSVAFSYQTATDIQALVTLYKNYFKTERNLQADSFLEGATTSISVMENGLPLTILINAKDGAQYVRVSYIKQ